MNPEQEIRMLRGQVYDLKGRLSKAEEAIVNLSARVASLDNRTVSMIPIGPLKPPPIFFSEEMSDGLFKALGGALPQPDGTPYGEPKPDGGP